MEMQANENLFNSNLIRRVDVLNFYKVEIKLKSKCIFIAFHMFRLQ